MPTDRTTQRIGVQSLKRLMAYVRPYWLLFIVTIAFGMCKFISPIAVIWLFGTAIDVLKAAGDGTMTPDAAWARILKLFLVGAGIAIVNPLPVFLRSISVRKPAGA